uniref:LIM zinc-binding domain-containing protein n=1 Tax=Knipowitschia caucasica TaxID=637954 RepID=A0AAV2JEA1_KNICA
MSQDAGREKVFQTTKVRTSIKSDLSWIQKMKEAENIKDSRDPPEERTPTLSRQLSYVLMTAKKFEPATSPEKEVQIGKHSTPIETPEVIQENVEIAVQSAGDDQPAMVDINPEEIFKAEPVVVMPSTCEAEESGPLEKEVTEENISEEATEIEPIPLVPSVAGENQAVFDLSNALEIVPTSESNEEVGKMEITRANDEATDVKTVKESEEPANNNGSSPRSTETSPKSFIMRDGQEVCSHCDQFIGPVKLTVEYPPMYLHPECLTCGKCTQNLGNLLIPMFEHNHLIYCSDCYDVVYTL